MYEKIDEWTDEFIDDNNRGAIYLLGLVTPDPSLSVLLDRALADLAVNRDKEGKTYE